MSQPKATVIITTRNRKDDLIKAIESCLNQTAEPQVLVVDDGSTDGTSEMVRTTYPRVVLCRSEESKGYIVQRNYAARMACAPIVFSIDDDACFSTPKIVEDILAEFENPLVGAVAIPFVDVHQNPDLVRQSAPLEEGGFVIASYIGTAHALRRDLFLQLGGYREQLFHQGEESDYCVRMLDAGYVVKIGRSDVIFHYESPKRDHTRWHLYGRRNNILFAWHNAPVPYLPFMLAGTFFNGIRHGIRMKRPMTMLKGLLMGVAAIPGEWKKRRPVRSFTFSLYRKLVKMSPLLMEELLACISKRNKKDL